MSSHEFSKTPPSAVVRYLSTYHQSQMSSDAMTSTTEPRTVCRSYLIRCPQERGYAHGNLRIRTKICGTWSHVPILYTS
ncbi:hypothetical protein A0H81_13216 [Grifola frondosa]|uniref:Uncharacterized protein n=1 Tax=Grifola frondosa TaxID=5627 RepID=A0A1C7LPY9_GRIFR|nr:hypothetical protein A0H81_13216 [Grifola frondosa]